MRDRAMPRSGAASAARMLDHLVATARAAGMTRLSLETGNSRTFAAANRLYQREGFERCGPFGGYSPPSPTFTSAYYSYAREAS